MVRYRRSEAKVKYQTVKTDVLVIGAGGAGLRAAIEAKSLGVNVLLLGKEVLGCAHTGMAMGGMNCALVSPATPAYHGEITNEGGYFINNRKMVKAFVDEMPGRIHDLENYGVLFDRTEDGNFYVWAGPKQKYPLNVCVGDYTGREMMQGLVDQVRKLHISYSDEFFISRLLAQSGRVVGAVGYNLKSGHLTAFSAKAVILATGGAGRMYQVTTNAASNTGDGYAMALDVGCDLVDMEMVQFHPTGMAFPASSRGVLVTEKVRAHGGILRNAKGERFMSKYFPKEMELAKRDEVSRSIYQEVAAGNGTAHQAVYLHVDHWTKDKILEQIPDVYEQYHAVGVDISKVPMEVYPSMHHMMGGIKVNEWGESSVIGLYAAGEVTGGVHGANRLGGNSIAEGQVFGRRAALRSTRYVGKIKHTRLPTAQIEKERESIRSFLDRKTGITPYEIESELKKVMWEDVGIFRDEASLTQAHRRVAWLKKEATRMRTRHKDRERNRDLQDCLEVNNMIKTAQVVIEAAIMRKESRGAHSRTDYPDTKKQWEKNIVVSQKSSNLEIRTIDTVKLK